MHAFVSEKVREFFVAVSAYVGLSVFFLFGLIISHGDVAQADWSIPITSNAAISDAHSFFLFGHIMGSEDQRLAALAFHFFHY